MQLPQGQVSKIEKNPPHPPPSLPPFIFALFMFAMVLQYLCQVSQLQKKKGLNK
jgi:hypothetical protein